MSRSRSRKRRGLVEITKLMDELRRSGMSVAAFARRVGVSTPTVYQWKRRLEQSHDHAQPPPPVPRSMVRVIPSGGPATGFPMPTKDDAGIAIILPGGLACRIEAHFDEPTLLRLMNLLIN